MTPEEKRKFNKENEDITIGILKNLQWYSIKDKPNKAGILVEDIIPILLKYVENERLSKGEK